MSDHSVLADPGDETGINGPDEPVPGPPHVPFEPPRRRRRIILRVGGVLLVAAALAGWFVRLPYYTESPGSVRETESRIAITGRPAFDAEGEVYFTTVSQRRATPVLLLLAWLDDTVDVQSEGDLFPDGDTRNARLVNQKMMDDSKFDATIAALRQLKLPVTITGDGAFIDGLLDGSDAVGKLQQGDVVTGVDGTSVTNVEELSAILATHLSGDTVDVVVRRGRGGAVERVSITLMSNDEDPTRGYLGVNVETSSPRLEMPFTLDIDSGEVTGPSAGLAWTLGVIDRLTPGELTGGRKVAVTGTISADGRVGPIGGIAQKVAAVLDEDIGVFLYPASTPEPEVERMRNIADGEIELRPVATLAEALAVLAPDGVPPAPGAGT